MTLDYQKPTRSAHDHIYSTLLGVLGFLFILGMVSLIAVRHMAQARGEPADALLIPIGTEGCLTAAIAVVLFIRVVFPAYRRWPTLGLNIILLVFVPVGTALGIYGLWKVDKNLPR
jgi:hypothetical protein